MYTNSQPNFIFVNDKKEGKSSIFQGNPPFLCTTMVVKPRKTFIIMTKCLVIMQEEDYDGTKCLAERNRGGRGFLYFTKLDFSYIVNGLFHLHSAINYSKSLFIGNSIIGILAIPGVF